MRRVPGAVSADHLIALGFPREQVIDGLIRQIGISRVQAECAWDYAMAQIDATQPHQVSAIHSAA
jgi:hypothetical protein